MSDIVESLRNADYESASLGMLDDAADEIETLRAKLAKAMEALREIDAQRLEPVRGSRVTSRHLYQRAKTIARRTLSELEDKQ